MDIQELVKAFAESKATKREKVAKLKRLIANMKSIGISSEHCDMLSFHILIVIDPDFKQAVSDMVWDEMEKKYRG